MIKRMTKTTSLLVAAAAVASVLPATGVSAATKLAVEEGRIVDAMAVNGGYIYNGYKEGSNEEFGVYLNINGVDKFLDLYDEDGTFKATDDEDVVRFGDHLINVKTGEVSDYEAPVDEDEEEDEADKAEAELKLKALKIKLVRALRDLDRYEELKLTTDSLDSVEGEMNTVKGWYDYSATTGAMIYFNEDAKYIETAVKAEMKIFDGSKVRTVSEFGLLDENDDKKAYAVEIKDVNSVKVIGDDANYIYRLVTVKLTGANETEATYLQKVSKAQGEKVDGAYLPKTVKSYYVNSADLAKLEKAVVVNGKLVVLDADEEVVTNIELNESVKISGAGALTMPQVVATDVEAEEEIVIDEEYVDMTKDAKGNIWIINKDGQILKSTDGGENFKVIFTCNRNLNKISVYNDGTVVAWSTTVDLYSVVQPIVEDEVEDDTEDDTVVENKEGWNKLEDGSWILCDANGDRLTGWQLVSGTWYYMDKTSGIMQTGWVKDGSTWYFLQSSGAMKTGWLQQGSTWYFLQSNGAMKTGWLQQGTTWYFMKESGAMATGWYQDATGTWYYSYSSGAMASNTTIGGYKLNASGAWVR